MTDINPNHYWFRTESEFVQDVKYQSTISDIVGMGTYVKHGLIERKPQEVNSLQTTKKGEAFLRAYLLGDLRVHPDLDILIEMGVFVILHAQEYR